MKIQSIIISMKPNKGFLNPKKNKDHNIFSINWIPKKVSPNLTFLFILLIQTRYRETPIIKNNVVHTGANTQVGGLKTGFWIF